MNSRNYGLCIVCGRSILYLGANFCSPACNFDHIAGRVRAAAKPAPVLEPVFVAVPAPAVAPAPEPAPEPAEEGEPAPAAKETVFSGFMFLEPPPDE